MSLDAAQKAALKAAILADPVMDAFPNTEDGNFDLAKYLSKTATPDFLVWRTDVPVSIVQDAITWSSFTPNDAPDGTAAFTNRILAVQTKQMNLQLMLQGRATIDAGKANIRSGLRDAVIALPTGPGGAAVSAGGASGSTVLSACRRLALRIEKVLRAGSAQTGTVSADVMGWEGPIGAADVADARNS